MNRRDFLRGIAGVTAAGIVLPSEEIVRRFWRGWSSKEQADTPISPMCYGEIPLLGDMYWNDVSWHLMVFDGKEWHPISRQRLVETLPSGATITFW